MQDSLDVLNAVDAFYSKSFDHLFTLAIWVIGLLGVILPIVVALIQRQYFKSEKKQILDELSDSLTQLSDRNVAALEARGAEIEKRVREEMLKEMEAVKRDAASLKAGVLHVQAMHFASEDNFGGALTSALLACRYSIDAKDEKHLQTQLRFCDTYFPKVQAASQKSLQAEVTALFDKVSGGLDGLNQNGRYARDIERLKQYRVTAAEQWPQKTP
jgi:hypothetical protein